MLFQLRKRFLVFQSSCLASSARQMACTMKLYVTDYSDTSLHILVLQTRIYNIVARQIMNCKFLADSISMPVFLNIHTYNGDCSDVITSQTQYYVTDNLLSVKVCLTFFSDLLLWYLYRFLFLFYLCLNVFLRLQSELWEKWPHLKFVNTDWLLACFKQKSIVSDTPFQKLFSVDA